MSLILYSLHRKLCIQQPQAKICLLLIATITLACGESPPSTEKALPLSPKHPVTIIPKPTPPPAPWLDPTLLSAGIAQGHFVPSIVNDKPYDVTDSTTGTIYLIHGVDLIEDDSGIPMAYPISPTEGHVFAATTTKPDGTPMIVDYRLRWNTKKERINGSVGVFDVVSIDAHKLGESPERASFEKNGEYWTRKPTP